MAWFVYLIECIDGSIYTGVAVDCEARFATHVAGKGARYTRSHPPARLIASIPCADRSTALKAEIGIKKLSPRGKRALAAKHAPCAEAPAPQLPVGRVSDPPPDAPTLQEPSDRPQSAVVAQTS